jgi:hypothetical protein
LSSIGPAMLKAGSLMEWPPAVIRTRDPRSSAM